MSVPSAKHSESSQCLKALLSVFPLSIIYLQMEKNQKNTLEGNNISLMKNVLGLPSGQTIKPCAVQDLFL